MMHNGRVSRLNACLAELGDASAISQSHTPAYIRKLASQGDTQNRSAIERDPLNKVDSSIPNSTDGKPMRINVSSLTVESGHLSISGLITGQ